MTILPAQREDLQEILDLQYLAYQSEAKLCNNPNIPPLTQTLRDIEQEFQTGIVLKCMDHNHVIVASIRGYAGNGSFYIGKLIVRPDLQGQGIGTKLLEEIERNYPYKRYELFTSSNSLRNIKLYERLGYVVFKEQEAAKNLKLIYLEKQNG